MSFNRQMPNARSYHRRGVAWLHEPWSLGSMIAWSLAGAGVLLMWTSTCIAQSRLPEVRIDPHLLALTRIKHSVAASGAEIPNFVCSATIQRTHIGARSMKRLRNRLRREGREQNVAQAPAEFSDTVRLEVGIVDGGEVYSWPGDEFRSVPLSEIVGFGMVESGSFSSFAKALFVEGNGVIRFSREEMPGGERMLRYEYEVSLFRSGYKITTAAGSAEVAYKGYFWARQDDNQLTRLTVDAVDIPPRLNVESLGIDIAYKAVTLAGASFILPESSVSTMDDADGSRTSTRTTFDNCRTFQSSSDLSFEAAEDDVSYDVPRTGTSSSIPAGIELDVRLLTEIASSSSKVGDVVQAETVKSVVEDDEVIVEKGAKLLGRLRRIQRVSNEADPFYAVSLEFTQLETGGEKLPVETALVRLSGDDTVTRTLRSGSRVSTSRYGQAISMTGIVIDETIVEEERDRGLTGVDSFYVRGSTFRIRKGLAMTWRISGAE